ncbi:response regulator transcription factor [Pedobacter sp. ISL-68]|uniref:response regulator n=1 Tax=unclassified Pedobacter TaxID=2628915 RepID=UPI001BE615FC|nr:MULTISPECIES: response regulator transcription factor [unclassified Pedobacter]MBT2560229.1 response regulator transcription factor [Pedobacter sp. ISL-64]MBT2589209.1 response regulator transcription factor [Pedobacter sp. ISL-68]
MSIRIAIFDDNKNIRDSIIMLLNTDSMFEIVGSFENAMNCIEQVRISRPDIVLMDIEMPGLNGIEAIKVLNKEFPLVQVLIQTVFEDDERVFDAISVGASGYILKNRLNSSLIDSLKDLRTGGAPMSPSIARKVLTRLQYDYRNKRQVTTEEYNLTAREKEVLSAIVDGLSHKMIGYKLNISYETVRSHIKKIYEKLHVASLTEVVAKAINHNIV